MPLVILEYRSLEKKENETVHVDSRGVQMVQGARGITSRETV